MRSAAIAAAGWMGAVAPAQVLDVVKPRLRLDGREPFAPARLSRRERRRDQSCARVHAVEEGVGAPRHHMTQVAVGGELLHVGVHVDHESLGPFAHGPVHGVALVEAGAEHEEAVELAAEDGGGGMPGAGIAEDAERQRMVLRKHAFGAQRGRDRNGPALGDLLQARGGRIVLDAGAGENGDTALCSRFIRKQPQRRFGGLHAQPPRMREEAGDRDVVRRAFADERVVREREVDRPARLRPHGGERMAEPVIQVLGRSHRLGQARERGHDRGVVERRLARILKRAAIFQVERHLAGQDQHRRAVGLGSGDGGCHVAAAGAADPERRPEAAAGAGIAVGHVDRAALVRRDHRRELFLPRQRREERVDQSARNHEQVTEALRRERLEDVVGAENCAGRGGGCHGGGCRSRRRCQVEGLHSIDIGEGSDT